MDGTLTDTLGYWSNLGPEWLVSHGYQPDPNDNFYDMLLRRTMLRNGFQPIDCEWWHFSLREEPYPDTYFAFPVSSKYLKR